MTQTIILKQIPTLVNGLYHPTLRNGKLGIAKDRTALDFIKYVKMEALRQKVKLLENTQIIFKADIMISKRKNYDIDAVLKLLLDSLEGVVYKNDKYIVDLHIRKHLLADEDEIVIMVSDYDK